MVWLVALAANLAICSTKLFLMVFMPALTVPTFPSVFAVMQFVSGTLLVFLLRSLRRPQMYYGSHYIHPC